MEDGNANDNEDDKDQNESRSYDRSAHTFGSGIPFVIVPPKMALKLKEIGPTLNSKLLQNRPHPCQVSILIPKTFVKFSKL